MNFTLHQLHILVKVAEVGSITQAAELLHLSQPAVSQQLSKLQSHFEIPLTEVVGRKLYITEFGKEMAAAAKNLLIAAEEIEHRRLAYEGLLTGKLSISIVSTGKYVMPYFLADFIRMHPGVALQMDVTNKAQVIQTLEQNQVDFALVSILPEHLDIERIPLLPNDLYLVGNAEAPTPEQPWQSQELVRLPLIFREPGSGTRLTMERFFSDHQLRIQPKMELATNEAVKQAVIAGLGYSIMPIIGLRDELENGSVKVVPVEGLPLSTSWHLIWLKRKRFSPAAQSYLRYIRSTKHQVIDARFGWLDQLQP